MRVFNFLPIAFVLAILFVTGCEKQGNKSPMDPAPENREKSKDPAAEDADVEVKVGNGVHVDTEPDSKDSGVQVDVGPNGINVDTEKETPK